MSTDESFDLPAAALRADGEELAMSIEVLASRLEQALPQITVVERRKVGGLGSRRRVVQRIAVTLGEEQFELRPAGRSVEATRRKVVRGITINRQELSTAEWIDALIAAVARTAEISEQDRLAFGKLLS